MIWNPKRLLWLLPTVLVSTLVSFWLVGGSSPEVSSVFYTNTLPTFFNLHPVSAERTAWEAAQGVVEGTPGAASQLLRVGAAAFPHVLPRLDQFDPEQRERVGLALLPLARRIGVLPPDFTPERGKTSAFWLSFWEEHFVNFRELSARRAVARFLESPTVAHERDVVVLDTFAFAELMRQLALRTRKDLTPDQQLARIKLIVNHLAHVTRLNFAGSSLDQLPEAERVAELWLHWWNANRYQYTSPKGVERFVAPLLQTRYAVWAIETASHGIRLKLSSRALLAALGTLLLLFSGLSGCAVGALGAAFLARRLPQRSRLLLEVPYLVAPAALVSLIGYSPPESWIFAMGALAAFGALLSFQQQTLWQMDAGLGDVAARTARLLDSLFEAPATNLVPNTGVLLSSAVALESLCKLGGFGSLLIDAIRRQDVTAVVGFTVVTTIGLALLQLLSDRLLRAHESAIHL